MYEPISKALKSYDSVVLIGSDTPEISVQDIWDASDVLSEHDCVLSPSTDGGYCLVGLSIGVRALFQGIEYSKETVLQETLDASERSGVSIGYIRRHSDIDTFEQVQNSKYFTQMCPWEV